MSSERKGLDDALSGTDDDSQLRLGLLAVCRAAGLKWRTAKKATHDNRNSGLRVFFMPESLKPSSQSRV